MACRIFIENPPPFKQAPRGEERRMVDVPIEDGIETARLYLNSGPHLAGLHHSDLDPYEVKQRAGKTLPSRYDSFEYVEQLKGKLSGFSGLLVPHRISWHGPPDWANVNMLLFN